MDLDFHNFSSPGLLRSRTIRSTAPLQQGSSLVAILLWLAFLLNLVEIVSPLYQSMHVHIGSSLSCVPKIGHSSTRHGSSFDARYTEHQHKFSLTYLSCITVVLFSEPRLVVHASTCPLWRSTAGWYLYGIPLLHRLWAQEDRAQQDSGQSTISNNWRSGWYWGNWCQTVVLQPIIDTFSVRFGRKHCDAARLGPRRRTIT